jgi:predicted Ser/Thr protein kinase
VIGRTLKHYAVESLLGKGGMGTVYRARDTRLQRPVALKLLAADLTSDGDRRRRFLQEARSAAQISHPAVAQIYDVDEADGVTFIAMELVEGDTVRRLIQQKDLDLLGALEVGIQVGEGLARAHELGIVHRDIKSENIMVTRDGHAKILDFGLAKLDPLRNQESGAGRSAEEHMSQLATMAGGTQTGMVVGTVSYMSPEQARGRQVDHRSDVFSLGVTLYEMATGQLPFSGDSPLDTMHAIAFEETRPITVLRQNLPPDLQRIISRCLRKRPEDRYQDVRTLVTELKSLKKDMDSGVTRAVPIAERFRLGLESLREIRAPKMLWIGAVGIIGVALGALLFTGKMELVPMLGLAVFALWLYRRYRIRGRRLMKRYAMKISKMPEVRLVAFQQNRATVVVDRMQAKVYMRANSLMESVNRKLFHGRPFLLSVRDDLTAEEFRRMLQEPGVLYVRDDVFELSSPAPRDSSSTP